MCPILLVNSPQGISATVNNQTVSHNVAFKEYLKFLILFLVLSRTMGDK